MRVDANLAIFYIITNLSGEIQRGTASFYGGERGFSIIMPKFAVGVARG